MISREMLSEIVEMRDDQLVFCQADPSLFASPRAASYWARVIAGKPVTVDRVVFQRRAIPTTVAVDILTGKIRTQTLEQRIRAAYPNQPESMLQSIVSIAYSPMHHDVMRPAVETVFKLHSVHNVGETLGQFMGIVADGAWKRYPTTPRPGRNHYPFHELKDGGSFFVPDSQLPASGRASIISSARAAGVKIRTQHTQQSGVWGILVTERDA